MPTYIPPQSVADNAQLALEVRAEKPESQRGMTAVGLARANQLAKREPVSIETIQRMVSYFARHEVDKQGSTWSERGPGWQAWMGWGGDEGRTWANRILKEYERMSTKAGQRHSEADMKILRMMRDLTKKYHNEMMQKYVDLGDDGFEYSDSSTDMQAQGVSEQAISPSLKIVPNTTTSALSLVYAWQIHIEYIACASRYNVTSKSDAENTLELLTEVEKLATMYKKELSTYIILRGMLLPVTLNEISLMVPEASILSDTTNDIDLLSNIYSLLASFVELLKKVIPITTAESDYDVQYMFVEVFTEYNRMLFSIARAISLGYSDSVEPDSVEPDSVEPDSVEPDTISIGNESDVELDTVIEYKAEEDRNATPRERAEMPDSDFVIPETRNFPIVTPDDIPAAVSSWGRYRGSVSFDDFKERLIILARSKGAEFVAALPQAWRDEMARRIARATLRY